jgi:hypothetical protein
MIVKEKTQPTRINKVLVERTAKDASMVGLSHPRFIERAILFYYAHASDELKKEIEQWNKIKAGK